MKRLLCTLMISAALLSGQDAPEAQPAQAPAPQPTIPEDAPVKVIPLKNVGAKGVVDNLSFLFRNQAQMSWVGNTVVVRGNDQVISIIESAIKELDQEREATPPPARLNVELTIDLLLGSRAADAGGDIPEELASTVEQLRAVFPYKSYKLVDSELQRGADGMKMVATSLVGNPNDPTGDSLISLDMILTPYIQGDEFPRQVTLDVNFGARVPKGNSSERMAIQTRIDVREGQHTVVGKTGIGADDAFILVITARVIEN